MPTFYSKFQTRVRVTQYMLGEGQSERAGEWGERDISSAHSSLNGHRVQGWARPNSGAWNSIWVTLLGVWGPKSLGHLLLLYQYTSGEPGWN